MTEVTSCLHYIILKLNKSYYLKFTSDFSFPCLLLLPACLHEFILYIFYVILKTAFTCLKHQTDSPSSFIFQLATSTGCRCPVSSRLVSTATCSSSGPLGVYSFLSRHLMSKQLPTHTHIQIECVTA